jgi:peptide/nickel transport system ATP-binding protein
VTVQAGILNIMERLREEYDMSVIFITHDLGVIAEIADRVLVMYKGKIVEQGSIFEIFANPKHPYTKGLIACRPRLNVQLKRLPMISDFIRESEEGKITEAPQYNSVGQAILFNAELTDEVVEKRLKVIRGGPLLEVKNLRTWFYDTARFRRGQKTVTKAVDDVSFVVYPGETVGLVGESGCGKTTLGRSILRLTEPLSGEIYFEGAPVHSMNKKALRKLREKMQIIFQDPYASLNPRLTIGQAIMEPMTATGMYSGKKARKKRVEELMEKVGLDIKYVNRYPHEFSGGQRQRASIARALALQPRFIICDESVSALDVSVQAQVLNLLNDLKAEFDFTYIFISHDLAVVKFMADRILVMNNGKLVEMGFPDALFERPKEEYTRKLINAIPRGEISDIRKAQLRRRIVYAKKSFRDN